jgi:pimeloyl-ACP methyl ester carboxylesterase
MPAVSRCFVLLCLLLALPSSVRAEDLPGLLPGSPVVATLMRLPAKTLGGDQFWADEFIRSGWRIQRNSFSGHYRLLDPDNYRKALGTYDACRTRFDELADVENISPKSKRAVILLHGLGRSRDCMAPLGDYLAEHGGFEVVNVSYPSTQADVREHALSLSLVLDNLEGIEEVNFVAHSLGNLVVRDWLKEHYVAEESKFKLGRFVMLGPPNNGAQLARNFKDNRLWRAFSGPSGKQLGGEWDKLAEHLGTPPCEFGIIAGAVPIRNPLISGDDDLLVSVEDAKLAGACDFRVLPVHHGNVRNRDVVGEMTLKFLQNGYFKSADERTPLK